MLSSLGTALGDRLGVRALRPAYAACLSAVYGRRGLPGSSTASRGLKIVAEMHPDQWPDFGISPREAHDRFAAMGLAARAITSAQPLFTQSGHAILEPLSGLSSSTT
jgi:hypothetical protein